MSSILRFDEWQDSNGVPIFDGSTGPIVNGLVAVKHVLKTDAFSQGSVAAGANVAVTDLSITHEVSNAANKLIISAFFGVAANSTTTGTTGIAVHDGTGLIAIADSAGNRTRVSAGGRVVGLNGTTNSVAMPHITFVHTPGAGSKTYTVRAINIHNQTQTLYVNRTEADTDDIFLPRAVSGFVIQEVAV
jgi:hypothetical protein